MVFEMAPVFSIDSLDVALRNKFGNAFAEFYSNDLRQFFFDEQYNNDSYMRLWLEEIDDHAVYGWTYNTIIKFLRDMMPEDTKYVLMDVSW